MASTIIKMSSAQKTSNTEQAPSSADGVLTHDGAPNTRSDESTVASAGWRVADTP